MIQLRTENSVDCSNFVCLSAAYITSQFMKRVTERSCLTSLDRHANHNSVMWESSIAERPTVQKEKCGVQKEQSGGGGDRRSIVPERWETMLNVGNSSLI